MVYEETLVSRVKKLDIITYHMMVRLGLSKTFGSKEMKLMDSIERRLYALFLRLIDKKSATRLEALDALIEETIDSITENTEWSINETGATMIDNCQNMEDFEFRSFDTHTILRDSEGFYVEDTELNKYDYESRNFLSAHSKEFEDLHRLYSEKEAIMCGEYSLRDENSDKVLPHLIANQLVHFNEKKPSRKLVC